MKTVECTLKTLAILVACVSALHLALGLEADSLRGIEAARLVAADPGLSSQSRFFGVSYALYGLVFWLAASDFPRYRPLLLAALVLIFIADLSRLVPWLTLGTPPTPVVCLLLIELLGPALLLAMLEGTQVGPRPPSRE